jgi:hypothetical protein
MAMHSEMLFSLFRSLKSICFICGFEYGTKSRLTLPPQLVDAHGAEKKQDHVQTASVGSLRLIYGWRRGGRWSEPDAIGPISGGVGFETVYGGLGVLADFDWGLETPRVQWLEVGCFS